MRAAHAAALAAAFVFVGAHAGATVIGGGGSASKDCLLALDAPVNVPSAHPRHVRCTDGEPSCDGDAVVDGDCEVDVSVCANSTFDPSCTLAGVQEITVEHALDNGDPDFDPDFQALQTRIDSQIELPSVLADDCTTAVTVRVPIRGPLGVGNNCGPRRKKIRILTRSEVIEGSVILDRDSLKLTCLPAANGCNPQDLFTGTFDRIQRQVFHQSCALSGCHDSQTQAAQQNLEIGSSYNNIVNQPPTNQAALDAGWLRVDGDPAPSAATSFLYHKVTGELPSTQYGERMPLGERKLHRTLREVIRLWIEAGAPAAGWVDGTF
jgi:hypothetical protein